MTSWSHVIEEYGLGTWIVYELRGKKCKRQNFFKVSWGLCLYDALLAPRQVIGLADGLALILKSQWCFEAILSTESRLCLPGGYPSKKNGGESHTRHVKRWRKQVFSKRTGADPGWKHLKWSFIFYYTNVFLSWNWFWFLWKSAK